MIHVRLEKHSKIPWVFERNILSVKTVPILRMHVHACALRGISPILFPIKNPLKTNIQNGKLENPAF